MVSDSYKITDTSVNAYINSLTKELIWHSEDHTLSYILIIKANEMHYFSTLFWLRTLHVLDRFGVHHQES